MDNPKSLFNNNTRVCENCKRPLPHDYKENLCPRCLDLALFHEVKEFIRTHDVNEYEVAEHFKIPLRQVKSWIKDGRIEYKQSESASTIAGLHCQRCGAPVTFGTLCPKCLRLLNGSKGFFNFFYRKTMRDKVGRRKFAFFNPLRQGVHRRFFFRTGRPLMHVQVEVIRSF